MQPTLPDPNVSVLEKLYSSGAFLCLGILVMFFVLRYLTKHWSWLATGGRHVWAVAIVGGIATLVVPASQGTTPNATTLVTVMITIVAISSDPKKIAALTSALAVLLVLSTSSGCSWTKTEAKTVETAAVDCTKGELERAVGTYAPVVAKLLQLAAGGDGKVDWSQVEDGTRALAGDLGGCIVSSAVAQALVPATVSPGAPKSSALVIDGADLRAHFEMTRKARFGGKTYITEGGTL